MKPDEEIISIGCGDCTLKDGKFVCYGEEEAVKCFWSLNITKNMKMFDFDENLGLINYRLKEKLAEHGLLGWEEYAEFHESIFGDSTNISDYAITAQQGYIQIYEEELREILLKYVSDKLKETYEDVYEFDEIQKTYEEILNADYLTLKEKILLFDKIIHLCHVTGSVLDIDISGLRKEFEEEIK